MKINQLFSDFVPFDILNSLLKCIPLDSLDDKRYFTKSMLIRNNTIDKFNKDVLQKIEGYYLPCKAKVYLENVDEKRFVTILKQVLRLYGYRIISIEKNICNKKNILYSISNEIEKPVLKNMTYKNDVNILHFE